MFIDEITLLGYRAIAAAIAIAMAVLSIGCMAGALPEKRCAG